MIFVESQEDWAKRQMVGPGSTAPLRGVKNVRAPAVMAAVLEYGGRPAPMWKILNKLAKAKKRMGLRPVFRIERRWDRLAYWRATRELIGVKLLYRHRSWLSTSPIPCTPRPWKARPAAPRSNRVQIPDIAPTAENPGSKSSQAAKSTQSARPRPEVATAAAGLVAEQNSGFRPKPKPAKYLSSSVGRSICQTAGSNGVATLRTGGGAGGQPIQNKLVSANSVVGVGSPKTQSARSPAEEVSAAARLIAKRPRPWKRKWTGVLHGERIRRRSLVRVPGGDVLPLYTVLRGKVYIVAPESSGRRFTRYNAGEVQRIKNPAAVVLGGLKRGVTEVKSAAKAAAARANGCQPPRPGSRPRGRPRRTAAAPAQAATPMA
jgi:hypothetical protein